ncbi:MAG: TonB-dependent receptor plug domain-containing protein, partial [Porticoccaceae bacterium]
MKANRFLLRRRLAVAVAVALPLTTLAAELSPPADDAQSPVFTLGRLSVIEVRAPLLENAIGTATVAREDMWDFSRDGLTDALNLIPGAVTTPGTGQRNETAISIRGFDRWQVPLMMDGIRLYLPADNRIDFDRFLTPDLAEIQVSKGYVSVLNGPDGMGGAINLVTRKPVKPFEAEVRVSAALAESGQYNGNTLYANLGGRQQHWYYQASAQQRDIDHWRLSRDFRPTAAENGGERNHSGKEDWRVALKTGYTPNETDEYSINFTKQSGEKSGIHSTSGRGQPWAWPTWDTWSVYWLSHTQLSETAYVKTRLYYNKFDNSLLAYTNQTRDTPAWISYYDDEALGGSVEVGTDYFEGHTLKAALHYRRDEHTEWERNYGNGFTEPKHSSLESVYSFALEETWRIAPQLELVAGISRDIRRSDRVEEYAGGPTGSLFRQPVSDSFATNYQGAL